MDVDGGRQSTVSYIVRGAQYGKLEAKQVPLAFFVNHWKFLCVTLFIYNSVRTKVENSFGELLKKMMHVTRKQTTLL